MGLPANRFDPIGIVLSAGGWVRLRKVALFYARQQVIAVERMGDEGWWRLFGLVRKALTGVLREGAHPWVPGNSKTDDTP